MNRMENFPNPKWQLSTKLIALVTLMVVIAYLIYLIRILITPILMSMVVAYILLPPVDFLHQRLRLPRTLAASIIYIIVIAGLIAIPAGTLPRLIGQINNFINNIPFFLEQGLILAEEPIVLLDQEIIPSEVVPLERLVTFSLNYVPTFGFQSVNIFGSLASTTISIVGWIAFVIFVSFYMVRDHEHLFGVIVSLVPEAYQPEIYQLGYELSEIWNSFLRGQLILFAIMGTIIFTAATIVGLPNALLLGFITGLAEFIPQIGAILAAIPAVLIAFFLNDQSWLGTQMSPLSFALLVMAGYIILQQIENYFLVPRVIGRSLNMHPLIVFVGALAGATLAGVLGILLAAPFLASLRLIFRYVHSKLLDLPPFPNKLRQVPDPQLAVAEEEEEQDKVHSNGIASSTAD